MEQVCKLLIIDDFQLSALGTKALLAGYSTNFEIFTAFSVDEGREVLQNNEIDIVLCDVVMPEKDGFKALEEIKEHFPDTKVMFLTISEDKETLYKALALGADGFQFKNVSKDELISSLKVLLSGAKYFHPRIINLLYQDLAAFASGVLNNKVTPAFNIIQNAGFSSSGQVEQTKSTMLEQLPNYEDIKNLLTNREMQIIELVGQNVSTKDIADKLNISAFTVSTHRKNIYVKLGLETVTQMKRLAKEIFPRNAG